MNNQKFILRWILKTDRSGSRNNQNISSVIACVSLLSLGFVLLEEPKKNNERKMIDLTDIQPTPALYQPDATNMPPDVAYEKLQKPKKNVGRKMMDLAEIQPTPATYEPLRQPDATNKSPDVYEKLQKPIVFNPKTDIPKAIASKNASNTIEAYYVE